MKRKHKQNMYHANINLNFMIESKIQIKSGTMINIDESEKNMLYVKKIISGILLYAALKMVNIYQVLLKY